MEQRAIRLSYDKDADVLYISFGKPQKGISEEMGSGIVVRRDNINGQIIGITIIDFEKQFTSSREKSLPITVDDLVSPL